MKNLSSPVEKAENITLLSVSADQDDHRSLRDVAQAEGWNVESVRSCSEALRITAQANPTVITCERELPDGSWRDLIHRLADLQNPPPVVVLSRHADERLWAEVLNLGGYDVLAKPLEHNEVTRVLSMAFRYGRGQTERLMPALS